MHGAKNVKVRCNISGNIFALKTLSKGQAASFLSLVSFTLLPKIVSLGMKEEHGGKLHGSFFLCCQATSFKDSRIPSDVYCLQRRSSSFN